MIWIIIFIVAVVLYTVLVAPQLGKFWHKHNWYLHLELEMPSIYSKNKVNIHKLYKCDKDNCWGYKVHTDTVKRNDEGI